MPSTKRADIGVCAVIVTLNPDASVGDRLQAIREQVDQIILVDNGSGEETMRRLKRLSEVGSLTLIRNQTNAGIGAALNQGLRAAIDLGFEWAVTLDQDSEPEVNMVHEQRRVARDFAYSTPIAIVGAQITDAQLGRQAPFLRKGPGPIFRRTQCKDLRYLEVTTAISSGSLVWLPAVEALGGYREDFFIDYVDTEFCLRALANGYRIIAACRAKLHHRLGNRRVTKLGPLVLYPTFHSVGRWYTISRNRVPMLREYALRFPHWFTYELIASLFTLMRMLIAEDQKLAKARAVAQGTWDGLNGRMGRPPDRYQIASRQSRQGESG